MICSSCQRSGYNFHKIDGKVWCGCCDAPGTRTITQGMAESRTGFNPYGVGGLGSLEGLPKLCSITEWREVQKLCRTVSNDKLLLEETPKTRPLPKGKNPLDGPDRTGWLSLDEYYKETPKPKTGNPYGFTPIEDFFNPKPHTKASDLDDIKRLMEG